MTPRARSRTARELTAGPLLARNSLLNLLGQGLPLLVAIVAIPLLVSAIGVERFGLLALAWVVIGYFSLFDLGIGRSLTQFVSERIGRERDDELAGLARTGLLVMSALGLAGWAVLHLLAPVFVTGILNVPEALQAEAIRALRILAVAVPFVVSTAGLRGLLEAVQRFGLVNAVRIPMGALTFLGPVAVLPFSVELPAVIGALAAVRVAGWIGYGVLLLRAFPLLRHRGRVRPGEAFPLLRFGGWVTVSNVVSPLMVHLDRVVIGAVLTMAAVAYYATPFEVVTRLWIVPAAVVGVLFPAFATSYADDRRRAARLFDRGCRGILLLVFPVVLLVVGLAGPGLARWVGPDFAREGAAVAQWLAVGVFVNSLAHVPFALLQAIGRPDLTAKLHLAEAPLYFLLLWGLLATYGLVGAAVAWTVRAALDAGLLFAFASGLFPECRKYVARVVSWILPAMGLLALAALPVAGVLERTALLAGLLALFGLGAWFRVLLPAHRVQVVSFLRAGRGALLILAGAALMAGAPSSSGASPPPSPGAAGASEAGPAPFAPGARSSPLAADTSRTGGPGSVSEVRRANSEGERYLRALQLVGRAPLHPWSIRAFSPGEVRRLAPEAGRHPWGRAPAFGDAGEEETGSSTSSGTGAALLPGGARVALLPVELRGILNTSFPSARGDGPIWAGRGLTGALSLGAEARWGPLTLTVAPALFGSQNRGFELMDNGRSGRLRFADARNPLSIDFPQRFGEEAYGRLDPGRSGLRLDLPWVAAGVSSEPQYWGPAYRFPLILGNEAPGFMHGFLGTATPLPIGIGRLHARLVGGRLEQSDYAPWEGLEARRFASALVLLFVPRGIDGLELGTSRFIHLPWREEGPTLSDLLRPIQELQFRGAFLAEHGELDRSNQLVSAFFRWAFPQAQLEVYGEMMRVDAAWDFRDAVVQPDHDTAYLLGFARAWKNGTGGRGGSGGGAGASARGRPTAGGSSGGGSGGRIHVLRGEVANGRISHLENVRPQVPMYRHSSIRQGHTHRGRILGSPAVYGGGGAVAALDTFEPWGRWTVRWERELRNDRWGLDRVEPGREHDVMHSLGVDGVYFRGPLQVGGELIHTWNLNRYFEEDATNLRAGLTLSYRF